MTGKRFRTQWVRGNEMNEYAEAVGVPNDCIMAVGTTRPITVLFTPPGDDLHNPRIYCQYLSRDEDGVLHRNGLPEEVPGMWDSVIASIEARLGPADD